MLSSCAYMGHGSKQGMGGGESAMKSMYLVIVSQSSPVSVYSIKMQIRSLLIWFDPMITYLRSFLLECK